MRFLVSDGEHVDKGQPFAEIEVMKMVMPVCASLSGCMKFQQNAGSILNPGTILGTLELDDPSSISKVINQNCVIVLRERDRER